MKIKYFNFIKNIIICFSFIFCFLILGGCNREFNKVLKSNNVNYILLQGNMFFSQKKYDQALQLYKHIITITKEINIIKNISYKIAMINFYKKNYNLAAKQFKNFYSKYISDKNTEEAYFYSAYSYYLSSPEYNLDQKNTYKAIEELQNFIIQYPKSEKLSQVNILLQILIKKLEKKFFEIAKTYYDIFNYKVAIKEFKQFIHKFPNSLLIEEAQFYILDSQYKLAINSDVILMKKLLKDNLIMIKSFLNFYSNSIYKEKILKIKEKILQNIK